MKTTIQRFTKQSWSKPYGVITEAETAKLNINQIWDEKNIVGSVDRPKNKQKFVVTYKGKVLGSVWNFGEARDLLNKETNTSCSLLDAD